MENSPHTLIAYGPNFLTVVESIESLGGGVWEYTYSFTNDDPDAIWHFLLYTAFDTVSATATGFPNNAGASIDLTAVAEPYDPHNIDPLLTDSTNMWYPSFGGPDGLFNGSPATLTFQATVFDESPKLFAYETIVSGYAGDSFGPAGEQGMVAAIGYTGAVPAPPAALVACGLFLGFGGRRRRLA